MKLLLIITLWLILFMCFPLAAIVALLLLPIVWLLSLPLCLIGIVLDAAMELVKAILLLPARLLGARVAA